MAMVWFQASILRSADFFAAPFTAESGLTLSLRWVLLTRGRSPTSFSPSRRFDSKSVEGVPRPASRFQPLRYALKQA